MVRRTLAEAWRSVQRATVAFGKRKHASYGPQQEILATNVAKYGITIIASFLPHHLDFLREFRVYNVSHISSSPAKIPSHAYSVLRSFGPIQ